jgi:hypothetical protein
MIPPIFTKGATIPAHLRRCERLAVVIYSIAFDASHLRRTYRVPRSGLESRFPDHIAGAASQGFRESYNHLHRDIVLPAFDEADIVPVTVNPFGKRFLRISKGFPSCTQGVPKI